MQDFSQLEKDLWEAADQLRANSGLASSEYFMPVLDELGHVARGRSRHRPRDAEHLYGGPHPFVQTGDIKHASLYLTDYTQTYSEAGLAQSKMWPIGTPCITIAANIAETAILGIEACFPDSVIGFVADDIRPPQADGPEPHCWRLPDLKHLRVDDIGGTVELPHVVQDRIAVRHVQLELAHLVD